jgi:hypothetical protein
MSKPRSAKRAIRTAVLALFAVLLFPGTVAVLVVHRTEDPKVKAWHAMQIPTIESQPQPQPQLAPSAPAPTPSGPGPSVLDPSYSAPDPVGPTGTSPQPRPPRQGVDPSLESGNTGRGFNISGDLAGRLAPGEAAALDLTLVNPGEQTIRITKLTVEVAPATSVPGCSGEANFRVRQASEDGFPVVLPAGSSLTLTDLGFSAEAAPQVEMLNLPVNQDACKGAAITLSYSGAAR